MRASQLDNATAMLDEFASLKDIELFGFTGGQFSLMELLVALLERTGPADVSISTWTAAFADISDACALLEHGDIRRFRLLIDNSFESRQPKYCGLVQEMFGPEAIRVTRIHAKFAVIRGGGLNLAVRTSMNLNRNRRMEQFEISDDLKMCNFLDGILDKIWESTPVGIKDESAVVEETRDAVFEH